MLYRKGNSTLYIKEFDKRFDNFCSKAPLLISYTITPSMVQIVDESTDAVYEVSFDFSIPVKSFIYGIKQLLINKGCYPILKKTEIIESPVTKEEQVELASNGTPVDQIPTKKNVEKVVTYLIDKCIIYHDTFLIKDIDSEQMFRFKLLKSSSLFLRKLRSKEKPIEEYSKFFFDNSVLLNEIVPKEETSNNDE